MRLVSFKAVFLFGLLSLACTTKVSEWVLLNAPADMYSLVYFYKVAPGEAVLKQNTQLAESFKNANIQVVNQKNDQAARPYYALYYGGRQFARYGSISEMKYLTTSSLRDKIAGELMAGKLCVLLYLTTGDKAKDDKGIQVINHALSSSPFRNIITVMELSRGNAEEAHFESMLLNVEDDLKFIKEPMLFGIFGKLKALEPLVAGGITEENIGYMIDFLTADCSCLIKDNLPGTDILYDSKWENPATAMVNRILDENPSLEPQ